MASMARTQGRCDMASGALEAFADCGFTPNGINLQWNGGEEGDEVSGALWVDLSEDGCLDGEIADHNGDETTFIAAPWARFSALLFVSTE